MNTLDQAIDLCRRLEAFLAPRGFHVGLTGSTLYTGKSLKDIDLIVYPDQSDYAHKGDRIAYLLKEFGMDFVEDRTPHHEGDNKIVYYFTYNNERIDIFILQ